MSYPTLNFDTDINFDKWTAKTFLKEQDELFVEAITNEHPELKGKKVKETFIEEYVEKTYKNVGKDLKNTAIEAEKVWKLVGKDYFEAVDKLFGKFSWPKGKYICFMSVFNCNPRFIEEKEFQVYYKHAYGTNAVCMHEMMHFIFYSYLETKFPDEFKNRGEDYIWKLSEVFNDVALRLPKFTKLTEIKEPGIYAQTQEELSENMKLWNKTGNVEDFIKSYFKNS